jgi:hypothetical protein
MTKFYGKRAEELAEKFLESFENGEIAPAIAKTYLATRSGNDSRPIDNWSFLNKVSCMISNCYDPRGFKQWQEVGRNVIKGERAQASILIPLFTKDEKGDDERKKLYGYKALPVFDATQTEGEDLTAVIEADFFEKMPLVEVAKKWEIDLKVAPGRAGDPFGSFSSDNKIVMRTDAKKTFLHELVHAAHNKLGTIADYSYAEGEVIAELGATVLAHMIGLKEQNIGRTKNYLDGWTENKTATVAMKVMGEIGKCIDLILQEAGAESVTTA